MTRTQKTLLAVISLLCGRAACGDTFTYLDQDGQSITVEAKLVGEGQGAFALELPDGELRPIPIGAVQNRQPGDDPEPDSPKVVLDRLRETFGEEKFRGLADNSYAIGLVLAAPLPKQYENRAAACLKKTAKFFKTVEGVFLEFMKDMKAETRKPRYPLVILIFETDDDFEKYAHEDTGGRGLSAGNILGYYNLLTNHLNIRMSECHTFETPLHEAIHQQVYNRGVLQRLAPLPAWFNEGLATGFEANGERINIGPLKVSKRYARQALASQNVSWNDVVTDDTAFRGDIFASEAYGHAWGMHWLLAYKFKKDYIRYLELLGEKRALDLNDAEQRRREFEDTFGKSIKEFQRDFPQALEAAARKQNVNLEKEKTPGYSLTTSNLAEVEITAVKDGNRGGALEVEGQLRNISLLRPMSYHVTVETDGGTYADWYIPQLAILKTTPLAKQFVQKLMENSRGGPSQTFRVRIKAVVPDSDTGLAWKRGDLPKPVFQRGGE